MFNRYDLTLLDERADGKYRILEANGHDATIQSFLTGHEWIIISNCADRRCRIRHRHSRRDPFHEHAGRYDSIDGALAYIEGHDKWFAAKEKARRAALPYDQSL